MKYAANIITGFRILCSFLLLLTQPLSAPFFLIYTLCGASDMADGYVARITGSAGKTGAMLDSVADMVFIAVALFMLIPAIPLSPPVLYGILSIALIRLTTLTVGFIKYRAFAGLHTCANKATGLLLFAFPYLYRLSGLTGAVYGILAAAGLSAVEELAITVTSPSLNRNVKCLFSVRPIKRKHLAK